MKHFLYSLNIVTAFLLLLTACSSGDNHSKNTNIDTLDNQETLDSISDDAIINLGLIRVNIPSPVVITDALRNTNVQYKNGIVNTLDEDEKYITSYYKAINLGVYGADLGYLSVYNQSQHILDYMAQIAKLGEQLGISGAFDKEFIEDMTENIGNSDTLPVFVNMAFQKAEKQLRSQKNISTIAVITAGGWIEGLYLAVQMLKDTDPDKILINRIWNHLYSFKYVMQLLNEFEQYPDCVKAIEDISILHEVLKDYVAKPSLSPEALPDIEKEISNVRNKFIGVEVTTS